MPSTSNVTIYSTPACHYCKLAKEYLSQHGVAFSEHNVASDRQAREAMLVKSGQMSVPVIDINGEIIVGFDRMKVRKLLELP